MLERILIAGLGSAFVITLLGHSPAGIGLWVAAFGFALQLFTALKQAGLMRGMGDAIAGGEQRAA